MDRRNMITAIASVAASGTLLAGCSANTGSGATPAERRAEIDKGFDKAMAELYQSVSGTRELASRARGILVFPNVLQAGFIVGGEYGEGALRVGGKTADYYKITAGSFGFQAGGQSKAVILMFLTQSALDNFRKSSGWTAGADASVSVLRAGANATVDSSTAKADIAGFALANAGLFAGATIDGSKISKLEI
jgi:lipid-binding SYLF domain-containing protein